MAPPATSSPAPQPPHATNSAGASSTGGSSHSLFRIYKSGQGYWTRLGTALGAALIILFTVGWLWQQLPVWLGSLATRDNLVFWRLAVVVPFMAVMGLVTWMVMNKPSRAEFLIETDNEMKRINWASRKELVGSTRVVIFFMLAIVLVLFFYDQLFHLFFWMITVLKTPPLGL